MTSPLVPLAERIEAKLVRETRIRSRRVGTPCWRWTGGKMSAGYGIMKRPGGAPTTAHRLAYETWVGPIPAGHEIDHLCRFRLCVNPAHLEALTRAEHNLRGRGIGELHRRKKRCPAGHAYDHKNTYVWTCPRTGRKGRRCRACDRARYHRNAVRAA